MQGIPLGLDSHDLSIFLEDRAITRRHRQFGRIQTILEHRLAKLTTQHLLAMLRGHYSDDFEWADDFREPEFGLFPSELANIEINALKRILATRPHVPRKRDRRAIALRQRGSRGG